MTWPVNKASTTYVDNDSDPIWRARFDINHNFDNVNSIIDEFNITTPADKQILEYNSSNSRFELNDSKQQAKYRALISFNGSFAVTPTDSAGAGVEEDYTSGYTIENANDTGITVGSDAGRSTIVFPAGSYVIRTIGYYSVGTRDILTRWTDSAGTTVYWTAYERSTDSTGGSRIARYLMGTVQTFTESTPVYMHYTNSATDTYSHPALHIWRIA